jgi:hypothetical protein
MLRPERPGTSLSRAVGALTKTPELNVAAFALLLNFAWEILQAPLFVGMAEMPHAQVTKACLQATVGDAVIMLLAYGVVSVVVRSRSWILASKGWQLSLFVAIGVSITAGIEWLATRGYWMASWNYLPTMPLVPGTDIGLVPLLQWIVLPLLTVWFARRRRDRRLSAPWQRRLTPVFAAAQPAPSQPDTLSLCRTRGGSGSLMLARIDEASRGRTSVAWLRCATACLHNAAPEPLARCHFMAH